MYEIIKQVILSGDYELSDMLAKNKKIVFVGTFQTSRKQN